MHNPFGIEDVYNVQLADALCLRTSHARATLNLFPQNILQRLVQIKSLKINPIARGYHDDAFA